MPENAALAARMTDLGVGAAQLARVVGVSPRTVGYWLSGKITWPNEPTRSKLVRFLQVNDAADIGFVRPIRRYLGHTTYDTAIVPVRGDWTAEAATNRRDALRAGGMALAGAVAGTAGGVTLHQVLSEPDHMAAALDAGTVSPQRLADLERTADGLAARINTLGKFALLDQTMGTFGTVRRLVRERQRTADQVRLIRTGAKLALVAGEILFDQHQFRLADRWYRTARSAALDIGDQNLADKALGAQTFVPEYSGDPRGVLDLVGPRLDSHAAASPSVACLWGVAARAHATLGDTAAFQRALDRSASMLEVAPDDPRLPALYTFPTRRLAFYETTGWVRLGNPAGAVAAGDRALNLYATGPERSPTEEAMVRLDQAAALAQAGEVAEACRRAAATLTDDDTLPAASVLIRAAQFDALLGDTTAPAVRDWREVLHATHRGRAAQDADGAAR